MEFIEIDEQAQKALRDRKNREAPDKSKGGKKVPASWLTFKPDTEAVIRILPPWTDEGIHAYAPYIQINQHWDVGPDSKRVVCPAKTPHSTDQRCFICEQIGALFDTGDKADEKRARRMYAGRNFLYQVIDRNDAVWLSSDDKVSENPELIGLPKIKFMRLPWSAHRQVLDIVSEPDYGNITSVRQGRDMKIKRTGTGLSTEYAVLPSPKQTPLFDSEDQVRATATLINRLDEHPFFRIATYDETKAIWLGEEITAKPSNQLSSGSSKGFLSAGKKDRYQDWVNAVKDGQPLDSNQLAAQKGYNVSDVPGCYAVEPDHEDKDCWDCIAKENCAAKYFQSHGKYSVKASAGASGIGKSSEDFSDVPF